MSLPDVNSYSFLKQPSSNSPSNISSNLSQQNLNEQTSNLNSDDLPPPPPIPSTPTNIQITRSSQQPTTFKSKTRKFESEISSETDFTRLGHHTSTAQSSKPKSRPKKRYESDIDLNDLETFRPIIIKRAKNYEKDEKKYEIIGAHRFNDELKFAVRHKDNNKIYWHTHEDMKIQHLGLILHYYETHIQVGEIVFQ